MATPILPEHVRPRDAVLLYDGLCGFCDGTVRWLLLRDRAGKIYFAAQQSELAQALFERHGFQAQAGNRVYLLVNPGTAEERILERSDAVVHAVGLLGGVWAIVAAVVGALPRGLRDAAYAAVARNRYWIAGRRAECRIPADAERARFLGL